MAGDMVYYEVRNEFYKDTDGALLVFDIGSHESFQALDRWTQEMKTELRKYNSSSPLKVCVCGNKVDRTPRNVSYFEASQWCANRNISYFETSALTGHGVMEAINSLLESIIEPDFARGGSFDGLRGVHSDTTFPPFVPKKGNVSSSYGNSEEVPVTTDYPVSSPKRSVRSRSPPSARECQFTAKPCYTPQQLNAVNRIRNATNNHERLGVALWASRDEINRAYRRLAFTVHPDKNFAPGSEEAFKLLVAARTTLLQSILPFTGYKFRTHQ
ncbi:unnamed protein product [Calicophoron daubneyi]|uniref:J domain-containing protein n=1 Tax=Calicophoron daubneyi TaxID=300641 RepID=A0AAV2U148_CALDB